MFALSFQSNLSFSLSIVMHFFCLLSKSILSSLFFSSNIYLKYECFQKSGSFKARGAINNILSSSEKDLENGITAVSAGNHAQ